MNVNNLSSFEAETLIRFFLNHLQPELRGRLMAELPVVYRKLLGRAVDDEFRKSVKDAVLDRKQSLRCSDMTIEELDTKYKTARYYVNRDREQALRDAERDGRYKALETVMETLEEDE